MSNESSKSGKMPPLGDTEGIKRWHNERGLPWGNPYDGPLPLVVRRMVPAGTKQLSNRSMHLANEHGINSDKAPRGPEVEHMHAHTFGLFRHGQEHYHGEVPEPEQAKPERHEGRRSWGKEGYMRFYGTGDSPKLDAIGHAMARAVAVVPGSTPEADLDILARELEARGWAYAAAAEAGQAKPEQRRLEWHEGEHGWTSHDGYPCHEHSLKGGVLTIGLGRPATVLQRPPAEESTMAELGSPATATLKVDWDAGTINAVRAACLAVAEAYESYGDVLPGLWNLNDAVRLRTAAEDIRSYVDARERAKQEHAASVLRRALRNSCAEEGSSS